MMRRFFVGSFTGQKVLVVGLGLHGGGAATVRWLTRQGAVLRVLDHQTRTELAPTIRQLAKLRGVTYRFGTTPTKTDVQWADMIVLNPGVPAEAAWLRWRRSGVPVVNEATLFFERAPSPVIGITGTRGKTTTTRLIAAMLTQAKRPVVVTGNVRQVAMLDQLERLTPATTTVTELSSFQLELLPAVKRSPHIAVMTNLHVDHLNRHRTMARYAQIKYHLVRYQTSKDFAILNADNAWTRAAQSITPATVIWFSQKKQTGAWSIFPDHGWVCEKRGKKMTRLFPLRLWSLAGDHQQANLLAATAAARAAGLPTAAIRRAVSGWRGVPYRQEKIRVWRGHDFINDTTATSPEGSLAAFRVWPNGVFIIGGTDKQLDFRAMADWIATHRLPVVFLPGDATNKLRKLLQLKKYRQPDPVAASMSAAVRTALRRAQPGQPIILSPGAASFGLFKHEFDRGDQFCRIVKALR